MNILRSFRIASVAALMSVALLITGSMRAQSPDSENINRLLAQAKSDAVQAQEHAGKLRTFTNSDLSAQSHATELNAMRDHVNDFGRVAQELTNARHEGSPWQKEAIDRINPLLRDLGQQLTDTINHLNNSHGRINTPEYRDYTEANYDLVTRTSQMITDFVEYGKAKDKVFKLEHKLEIASSGGQ